MLEFERNGEQPTPVVGGPGPAGVTGGDPEGRADQLQGIQSITDRALSGLDPAAMLQALTERVRESLGADTAAVLLLDKPSGQLVATAASGLEEEVRQGVKIRIGQGFAGRIAAQKTPIILDRISHANVANSILLDKGVRSLVGAPLLADGEVIGVLHVGSLTSRTFTSQDADLLQLAADRAAIAVRALTAQLDRAAASALQRSLLPAALPAVDGAELAARYVPGTGTVGGDWYDVFVLPSGQLCVVIGDVAGSGLRAATIMGRIRSALRAYALETSDPADILARLERKIGYFEPDALVTVLCAVFSPTLDEARVSCAGHLPPVVCRPGEAAHPAHVQQDPLIGLPGPHRRHVTAIDVPPETVLCFYTDGLVERRDRSIDDGIGQLCSAIVPGHPEAGCARVMTAMEDFSPHSDDVALLMFRRAPGACAGPGAPMQEGCDDDLG